MDKMILACIIFGTGMAVRMGLYTIGSLGLLVLLDESPWDV